MDDTEKQQTIATVADRLAARYPDAPKPLIVDVVADEYDTLNAGRIRTYIPTLIEKKARNRLRDVIAQTEDI